MQTTHLPDVSDSDLLAAVAAGDQPAFERLYGRYQTRVYRYVVTLVADTNLAEDVSGETMMAVWTGAGTFSQASQVSTWILGIARHKALDALRRLGRHQRQVGIEEATDLPAPEEPASDGVYRKQTALITQRALKALSVEHQEILRLAFFEDLPYEDIATLLSIPPNTVKTRVYYAKQQLKLQLARLHEKEPMA